MPVTSGAPRVLRPHRLGVISILIDRETELEAEPALAHTVYEWRDRGLSSVG